MHGLTHDKG